MTLSTVTLKWDLSDLVESGVPATLSITPSAQMSDATDHILIPPVVRQVAFTGGTGQLAGIVANDNGAILPAGTGYLISVTAATGQVIVPQFQTQILTANGATQWLDQLAVVPVVTTSYQYLPLPSGTPAAGQVPVATGSGEASAWAPVSGQMLRAPAVYAPASATTMSTTSSTLSAVSSSNVNTGAFTAPPSGTVLVTVSCVTSVSTSISYSFGLAQHGSVTPACNVITTGDSSAAIHQAKTMVFEVTGLTPGASTTLDLLYAIAGAGGNTLSVVALGSTSATPTGVVGGPVTMTVQAV